MAVRESRRRERGASLVEFALIVPLLSMFLFAIVQFGLAYDKKQSINSAAREGARAGAIPTKTVQNIRDTVNSSYDGTLLDGAVVTTKVYLDSTSSAELGVSSKPCEGNAGRTVVVSSTVPHVLTIPFLGAPTLTLKGKGEFRCERN